MQPMNYNISSSHLFATAWVKLEAEDISFEAVLAAAGASQESDTAVADNLKTSWFPHKTESSVGYVK